MKKNFLSVQPYDKKVEAIPPASNKNQTTNQLACERQTFLLAHRAEATNQLTESMYREDTETDKFHWFELQLLQFYTFIFFSSTMNGCVKFLLLMCIVVGFVQVNFSAGKQYDIKHCWGPYEFHKLLENHCSFHVGKRSIRREGMK